MIILFHSMKYSYIVNVIKMKKRLFKLFEFPIIYVFSRISKEVGGFSHFFDKMYRNMENMYI
jgi:hypothetical protein